MQLGHILVDARVVQLPQCAENFVELTRVDILCGEIAPQLTRFAGPLAYFAAQLPDVLLSQAPVATPSPAASVSTAQVVATQATVCDAGAIPATATRAFRTL